MNPELIIFDCDGTLVDSEKMYIQLTSDMLTELGYPHYSVDFCRHHFIGRGMAAVKEFVEKQEQTKIADDFVDRFSSLAQERLEVEVKPVPYAVEAVELLSGTHKTCVASNGERDNVTTSVRGIGLYDIFGEEKIFTKNQVARGKPFPDLFLYAANQMGVLPERCIVIEDSLTGVRAGVAAGMQVIGITAVSHEPQTLAENMKKEGAARVCSSWPEILQGFAKGE